MEPLTQEPTFQLKLTDVDIKIRILGESAHVYQNIRAGQNPHLEIK